MQTTIKNADLPAGTLSITYRSAPNRISVSDLSRLLVGLGRVNLIYRISNEPKLRKHSHLLLSRHFYYLDSLSHDDFSREFQILKVEYGSPLVILIAAGKSAIGLAGFIATCLAIGDHLAKRKAINDKAYDGLLSDIVGLFLTRVDSQFSQASHQRLKSIAKEWGKLQIGNAPQIAISSSEELGEIERAQLRFQLPDWLD